MKATIIALAALLAFVAFGSPAPAQSAGIKKIIITMRAKSSAESQSKILRALSAQSVARIASNGTSSNEFLALVAEVPAELLVKSAKNRVARLTVKDVMNLVPGVSASDVLGIEEDFTTKWIEAAPSFQTTAFPSVESVLKSLPKLQFRRLPKPSAGSTRPEITWGVERVKAPAAWDYTEGKGVRVAVVDTGVYSDHNDLKGKVDGGYDAFTKSEVRVAYQDGNGHGTHVAGTIAAIRNGKGVAGVAPMARLYSVRVLDNEGSGSISGIIDGIIWCANNGIQVANMSLGSSQGSDALHQALRYAKSRGVVIVAAAGNSGGPVGYPAAYPETIAVAASDPSDKVASFSSRGPEVDFIAPGVSVVSTAMDGGYANFSGTSMATPHMSGLAALAVSQGWVGLDGPDGVFQQLRKAAKRIAGVTVEEQGFGMIDAGKLVR
ncbi:MAG TPA: peptidase S8 [Elusimicrobia bacterium]|nr:peptidase S8 [Elusimicrobiota bacterium]HBT61466.1 peptidase S8 [Elusimicrobiota bacterium]